MKGKGQLPGAAPFTWADMQTMLHEFPGVDAVECRGCRALIEIPYKVRNNAEERLMWKEKQEAAHKGCGQLLQEALEADRIRRAWGAELGTTPVPESARN